ncbi:MAG: VWA domain-containing protein, partial [Acidobacteria bacterium]|nr:VWA domain-containing protein [Acidobacteriota bacterium]
MRMFTRRPVLLAGLIAVAGFAATMPVAGQEGFRFRSGVDLINVTATVTDRTGRFLAGLTKDDFVVYEDDQPVEITHFSAESAPVSLGIVLDTSGSMQGDKWNSARDAIDRFLAQLAGEDDDFFLYSFSGGVKLLQDWTNDRQAISWSLGRVRPNGGTAMYDAVAEAVPMAHGGRNRKKAVVIISDGNDTSSQATVREIKQMVRETEVLVYAVGIDGQGDTTVMMPRPQPPIGGGPRLPMPFPGTGR